jgi:phosphatidylserine/phosphatidylglycerophosphate/cardiolipin synthase-like enzyme
MVRFLDSHHIVSELSEIMKSSEKFLIIISPYLKISNSFKNILKSLNFQKIDCRIIYDSRSPLKKDEIDFLQSIKRIKLLKCENLHAKCFINEKMGIITSMNLYEYSQSNNWEMGISFTRKDDADLYLNVLNDINFRSKNFESQSAGLLDKLVDFVSEKSYCVRCKAVIDYNPKKPLCDKCYPIWAQFKKPTYPEKYCHGCGQQLKNISVSRPLCSECFQENLDYNQ